jgi:glycogen synthase
MGSGRDLNLPVPFSASKMTGKAAARRRVLETFGPPPTREVRRRPLVAMISRMVEQKGLLGAFGRALVAFENRPAWRRIQKAGMHEDFRETNRAAAL